MRSTILDKAIISIYTVSKLHRNGPMRQLRFAVIFVYRWNLRSLQSLRELLPMSLPIPPWKVTIFNPPPHQTALAPVQSARSWFLSLPRQTFVYGVINLSLPLQTGWYANVRTTQPVANALILTSFLSLLAQLSSVSQRTLYPWARNCLV